MAKPLQQSVQVREIHYPGEPWSVNELDHIPHLHHIAKCIRDRIHATNKTLRDINLQNKQEYDNFFALFNSDLVFRLTITKEYHLLLSLFKNPNEKTRLIKFLKAVQAKKWENHQKQQHTTSTIIKMNASSIPIYSESNQRLFLWTHPDPNLSNIEKWQHYEKELERITFNYHTQRTQLYRNACDYDTTVIDDIVIELRRSNKVENRQIIAQLESINRQFILRKQEIMNMPLYKPDGSYDLNAAKQQDEAMGALNKKTTESVESVFRHYGNGNTKINQLHAAHKLKQSSLGRDLRWIDKTYQEEASQLKAHIQASYSVSKKEVHEHLQDIIQTVKEINVSTLNNEQKEICSHLVNQLNGYKEKLNNTDNFKEMQLVLGQINNEINKIGDDLPQTAMRQIKVKSDALEKMVITTSSMQGIEKQPPLSFDPGLVSSPQKQVDPKHKPQDMQEHHDIFRQTHIKEAEELLNENSVSLASNEVMQNAAHSPIINMQREMKAVLQDVRGDSNKITIDEAVNNVLREIQNEESRKPFTQEEQDMIEVIKEQIKDIKNYEDYQEVPHDLRTLLSDLSDNLEELGDQCDRLNKIIKNLNPVFDLLENSSLNQNSTNLYQS